MTASDDMKATLAKLDADTAVVKADVAKLSDLEAAALAASSPLPTPTPTPTPTPVPTPTPAPIPPTKTANVPAFGFGVFVGNPNGNDQGAMTDWRTKFDAHVAIMGRPKYFNAFTDFSQSVDKWTGNASWTGWSYQSTGPKYLSSETGAIPVVGVMFSQPGQDWGNSYWLHKDITAGMHDDVFRGILNAWAGNGYKTIHFRPDYEFNGNFMPGRPNNDGPAKAMLASAFRQFYTVMHTEAAKLGVTVYIHWCPTALSYMDYSPLDCYPGDDGCDIISIDVYGTCYPQDFRDWSNTTGVTFCPDAATWAAKPENRRHHWLHQNAKSDNPEPKGDNWGWSLAQGLEFAKLKGKPFSIDECGSGPSGSSIGLADDPEFPKFLGEVILKAIADGIEIANLNVWDTWEGDGNWDFRTEGQLWSKPLARAAWKQLAITLAPALAN